MKKAIIQTFSILLLLLTLSNCREDKSAAEKAEERIEEAGEEIEEGIEEVEDEIDDATDDQ